MSLAEIGEGAVQVKVTTHDKPLMGVCLCWWYVTGVEGHGEKGRG